MNLLRGLAPKYDYSRGHAENFETFFDWALELENPEKQLAATAVEYRFGGKIHRLGFTVLYLSAADEGMNGPDTSGIVRVDMYPPGAVIRDDIHSHGFDFVSGLVKGEFSNVRHYPDFRKTAPEGEGYIGFETSVDAYGNNNVVQATDATIYVPPTPEVQVLKPGDTYTMRPRVDFHSIVGSGAITIFCKTPTYEGHDGQALFLRKPGDVDAEDSY